MYMYSSHVYSYTYMYMYEKWNLHAYNMYYNYIYMIYMYVCIFFCALIIFHNLCVYICTHSGGRSVQCTLVPFECECVQASKNNVNQ